MYITLFLMVQKRIELKNNNFHLQYVQIISPSSWQTSGEKIFRLRKRKEKSNSVYKPQQDSPKNILWTTKIEEEKNRMWRTGKYFDNNRK